MNAVGAACGSGSDTDGRSRPVAPSAPSLPSAPSGSASPPGDGAADTLLAAPLFVDAAGASGLDFVHANGMTGERYFVELVGSGAALFDMDGDGDLDLYAVQGHPLGDADPGPGPGPGANTGLRPIDALYRNDPIVDDAGRTQARFTDVTAESGIREEGYGMGVAVGDVDGDGLPDLYVTNWGPNSLWRNLGGGRFEDWTEASGTSGGDAWSTSGTFFDFDGDGDLDLYVANYTRFSYADHHGCFDGRSGEPDYCGPSAYPAEADRLFRNRGDGRFDDVTAEAGIAGVALPGLGVAAADLDGDGRLDVYVANDGTPNLLWRNLGDGRFEDVALRSGSAVNAHGEPEAGMGVAAEDFDHDGDIDLFLTHLTGETNTVYENNADGIFRDRSLASGLGQPSLMLTGFGIGVLDLDLDGWLDLYVANGAVSLARSGAPAVGEAVLAQPDQVYRNLGNGTFQDVSALAGPAVTMPTLGRGVAAGDVDNDGDRDLVVIDNNGPIRLLINQASRDKRWIGFRFDGGSRGRGESDGDGDGDGEGEGDGDGDGDGEGRIESEARMLGARVRADLADGRVLWRRVHRDGSYCSSSDERALFGLGADGELESITMYWNGGAVEHWRDLAPGRYHELRAGTGTAGEPR